jgi:hypothetical protein
VAAAQREPDAQTRSVDTWVLTRSGSGSGLDLYDTQAPSLALVARAAGGLADEI